MAKAKYRYFKGHYLTDAEIKRFWSKVDIRGDDDCWPWMGAVSNKEEGRDYGRFSVGAAGEQVHLTASRVALQLSKKRDLGKRQGCHRCDNPPCCNPKHLFAGNQRANIIDMHKKGRQRGGSYINSLKTHCPKGHQYTPANTRMYKGNRNCKACGKAASLKHYQGRLGLATVSM